MKLECERCAVESEGCQVDDSVNGYQVKTTVCAYCSCCRAISVEGKWETLDRVTLDHHPDGLRDALGPRDVIVHYVLSQILFASDLLEDPTICLFDKPDPSDKIRLLVNSGQIVGFYTIKPKGTMIEFTNEAYCFNTLDTIYVSKKHRGRGLAGKMLKDLIMSYPDQDIGVSKPISDNMLRVFQKHLLEKPEDTFKFWQVEGGGGEGRRKLVYFEIMRKNKNS